MHARKAYRIKWFKLCYPTADKYQQEYFMSIMDAAKRMEDLIAAGYNPSIDTIEIL